MNKQISFIVIIFLTAIVACSNKKKLMKRQAEYNSSNSTIVNNKPNDEFLKFEAHYLHTTESSYEEVKIKDGKIFYILFRNAKGNASQKNISTSNDLNTKEADITEQDIDSLSMKINKFNFWELDTLIGNPAATDNYYSFELSFKTILKQKNVIFKSIPGGITMPVAFMKSRDELMKLALKKIKI